jgi:hypothetical protein
VDYVTPEISGDRDYKSKPHGIQSASEVYRLSNRHLAKFSARFCRQRGVARSALRVPMVINLGFLDLGRYFSFK